MRTFIKTLALLPLLNLACVPRNQSQQTSAAASGCPLPQGDYVVQSAAHDSNEGVYELLLLGAPSCVHQPLRLTDVQLARLEGDEKEKAKLHYGGDGTASVLNMAQDFQIKLVENVVENGRVVRHETSSWSPFLASAGGAMVGSVVGGMIANSFRKPQYYTPPPAHMAQNGVVSGFGGSGLSRDEAARSYQRKYPNAAPVNTAPQARPSNAPSASKGGFFAKKPEPAASGSTRSYQRQTPPKASGGGRGFFGRGGGRRR